MAGHLTARAHHPETTKAWVAVAVIPVAFVVAMVVGEGLLAMRGYESGDDASAGAIALAGGTAMLVFVLPCLVAWILGRRAQAAGEPQGATPALVGAVAGLAFVGLNLLQLLARIVGL